MNDSDSLLRDIERAINRLEDKIDVQIKDHESRLRILEKQSYKLLGVSGFVGGLLGIFGSQLKEWLIK